MLTQTVSQLKRLGGVRMRR